MSTRSGRSSACGVMVLTIYLVGFMRYAPTFQNELTLWLSAVQIAPEKPRPHLQLVLALVERHRFQEAQIVLDHVAHLVRDVPTMPLWDRDEAAAAVLQDRLLLSRAAGTGPSWK